MTDDEAKRDLERAIKWGIFGSPPSVETMRHAWQAIEDRREMIELYDVGGWNHVAAEKARRHMRGE